MNYWAPFRITFGSIHMRKHWVWTQVNDLVSGKAARHLLTMWQAYLDESEHGGVFVIAGLLAPAENWVALAKEWQELLPLAKIGKNGKRRFKMSEMASSDAMAMVPAFYRSIEKHAKVGLAIVMRPDDLKRSCKNVIAWDDAGRFSPITGELVDNPYLFAFTRLMHAFHSVRQEADVIELVPVDERVDFIFDERGEKEAILDAWDDFLEDSGPLRSRYGAIPRFENDDNFLPLQAADLLAWWVRRWHEEDGGEEPYKFGRWEVSRDFPIIRTVLTEAVITQTISDILTRKGRRNVIRDSRSFVTTTLSS